MVPCETHSLAAVARGAPLALMLIVHSETTASVEASLLIPVLQPDDAQFASSVACVHRCQ